VTTRDRPLRLRDVREHPAFGGFPQHHPLMTSFMGMPIRYKGHAVGNLYVANKRGAAEFTERDEQLIEMLANGVGVAIETARLFTAEGLERAWLETVVDQMPEGVLLMDAEGRVTVANRFMRSLASVDTPQRDRFGNPMRFDLRYPSGARLSPDDLPIVKALTDKMTTDGHEFIARRADGRMVPLLVSAAPIRSANGTLAGATMILQDASTLKELEQMREEWATIVAHDLQQPIHTILLRSDLLASGPLTAEQAEGVRQVRVAVKRLSRMVRDLMEASKLETRRLQISFDRVDLGRLIRDIVVRIPDVAPRVEVSTPSRESLFVRGDSERLEQVVTNLLSNAVKYGASDAPIKVDVVVDAGYAQVSVTNSGAGISAAELPFIFERYARSHSARTTGIKGLGLGLYIAKGLIEGHGGRIWVESVPDKTTTFHFTVPLDDFGYATTSQVESPDRRIESTVEFHP
jgi:signal transduction histidine kinase